MYNVLMSKFEVGYPIIKNELRKIIKPNSKVVIIPWSFATELETKNINEFFNESRKKKYLYPLYDLDIKENNIIVLDCYRTSKKQMINEINNSNVLILTGGNPEMLYTKIINSGLLETIKNYKGVIMGSSAGAEIQLKRYFITKNNNYYNKFGWYDGLGIIDNDFYFDVHSIYRGRYLPSLKEISNKINKTIYCLFDDGVIIYDRKLNKIEKYGNVIVFKK